MSESGDCSEEQRCVSLRETDIDIVTPIPHGPGQAQNPAVGLEQETQGGSGLWHMREDRLLPEGVATSNSK